jgi:hypothetical protein
MFLGENRHPLHPGRGKKGKSSLDNILVNLANMSGEEEISTLEGILKRYTRLDNSTMVNYNR